MESKYNKTNTSFIDLFDFLHLIKNILEKKKSTKDQLLNNASLEKKKFKKLKECVY